MHPRKHVFEHAAKIMKVDRRVSQHQKLGQCQLSFAENPESSHQGLAWVALAHDRRRQRMKSGLAVTPKLADTGHDDRKYRRQQRLQVIADEEIFLPGLADHGRGINRVAAVGDCFAVKNRVVVFQRVVTIVIAERTFWFSHVRLRMADESKFRFGHQTMRATNRIFGHA